MAETEQRSLRGEAPIRITDLYNSSPSKIQPWLLATGGIPMKAKMCDGNYGPDMDSTHGVPQGGLLIMENAPRGLRPDMSTEH